MQQNSTKLGTAKRDATQEGMTTQSTVKYTTQHNTIQYSTVQHSTVLLIITQHSIVDSRTYKTI